MCVLKPASDFLLIFKNPRLREIHFQTMAEGVTACFDCAYLPYCGSDPVYHYTFFAIFAFSDKSPEVTLV